MEAASSSTPGTLTEHLDSAFQKALQNYLTANANLTSKQKERITSAANTVLGEIKKQFESELNPISNKSQSRDAKRNSENEPKIELEKMDEKVFKNLEENAKDAIELISKMNDVLPKAIKKAQTMVEFLEDKSEKPVSSLDQVLAKENSGKQDSNKRKKTESNGNGNQATNKSEENQGTQKSTRKKIAKMLNTQ